MHILVPSSPPTNLAVIVQNSTAALISWSPPPQTDHNGIITTYTVTLVNKKTDLQIKYNTLATSLIVDTLSPFTNYELAVTANTSVGMGPQSVFLPFLTNEAGNYNSLSTLMSIHIIYYTQLHLLLQMILMSRHQHLHPSCSPGLLLQKIAKMASLGPMLSTSQELMLSMM